MCKTFMDNCLGNCIWTHGSVNSTGKPNLGTCRPNKSAPGDVDAGSCANRSNEYECLGIHYGCKTANWPRTSTPALDIIFKAENNRCKQFNSQSCTNDSQCKWDNSNSTCVYNLDKYETSCSKLSTNTDDGGNSDCQKNEQCQVDGKNCVRTMYCASQQVAGMYTNNRLCSPRKDQAVCSKWDDSVWNKSNVCAVRLGEYSNDMVCTNMQDGQCIKYELTNPDTNIGEGTYTQDQVQTLLDSTTFDSISVTGPQGCTVHALGNILTPGDETNEIKYLGAKDPIPYIDSLDNAQVECNAIGFDHVCRMSDIVNTPGKCKCGWINNGLEDAWTKTGCPNPMYNVSSDFIQQWRNPNLSDIEVYYNMFALCAITQSGGNTGGICTAKKQTNDNDTDWLLKQIECSGLDQSKCIDSCVWRSVDDLGMDTLQDVKEVQAQCCGYNKETADRCMDAENNRTSMNLDDYIYCPSSNVFKPNYQTADSIDTELFYEACPLVTLPNGLQKYKGSICSPHNPQKDMCECHSCTDKTCMLTNDCKDKIKCNLQTAPSGWPVMYRPMDAQCRAVAESAYMNMEDFTNQDSTCMTHDEEECGIDEKCYWQELQSPVGYWKTSFGNQDQCNPNDIDGWNQCSHIDYRQVGGDGSFNINDTRDSTSIALFSPGACTAKSSLSISAQATCPNYTSNTICTANPDCTWVPNLMQNLTEAMNNKTLSIHVKSDTECRNLCSSNDFCKGYFTQSLPEEAGYICNISKEAPTLCSQATGCKSSNDLRAYTKVKITGPLDNTGVSVSNDIPNSIQAPKPIYISTSTQFTAPDCLEQCKQNENCAVGVFDNLSMTCSLYSYPGDVTEQDNITVPYSGKTTYLVGGTNSMKSSGAYCCNYNTMTTPIPAKFLVPTIERQLAAMHIDIDTSVLPRIGLNENINAKQICSSAQTAKPCLEHNPCPSSNPYKLEDAYCQSITDESLCTQQENPCPGNFPLLRSCNVGGTEEWACYARDTPSFCDSGEKKMCIMVQDLAGNPAVPTPSITNSMGAQPGKWKFDPDADICDKPTTRCYWDVPTQSCHGRWWCYEKSEDGKTGSGSLCRYRGPVSVDDNTAHQWGQDVSEWVSSRACTLDYPYVVKRSCSQYNEYNCNSMIDCTWNAQNKQCSSNKYYCSKTATYSPGNICSYHGPSGQIAPRARKRSPQVRAITLNTCTPPTTCCPTHGLMRRILPVRCRLVRCRLSKYKKVTTSCLRARIPATQMKNAGGSP